MSRFSEQLEGVMAIPPPTKTCLWGAAIDGKVLRRSFDGSSGKSALHMLSAWDSQQSPVLAQISTDAKSKRVESEHRRADH